MRTNLQFFRDEYTSELTFVFCLKTLRFATVTMDIFSIFRSFLKWEPTSDQNRAMSAIINFVRPEVSKDVFVLRGYAGTGKTSLLGAWVKCSAQLDRKVVLLAPTGRAAKVLSRSAGKTAFTIHKYIYRVAEGHVGYQFMLRENKAQDTLFVVDEASMIGGYDVESGSDLLGDLIQFVFNGKRCKLMFIGDIAQLPPVGSENSPALVPKELRNDFGLRIDGVELKEVVRQQLESGILLNATRMRQQIEEEEFKPQISLHGDVKSITGYELPDTIDELFSRYGEDEAVVLTYSNKRAVEFNLQIRARLLYREEELEAGDKLMIVRNNYTWLDEESNLGFLANGDRVEVMQIFGRYEEFGMRFADTRLRLLDYPDSPEIEARINLDILRSESASMTKQAYDALYAQVEQDYMHLSSKIMRKEAMRKDPFLNALQVKYAYALTGHKAQGGQWSGVIVDQGFITEDRIDKQWMRWLYTTTTRAVDELYFLNFHSDFFVKLD